MTPTERTIIRETLRRHFPEAAPFLFGSRATGTGWRYSDCDIYLDTEDDRETSVIAKAVEGAREEFADSRLPFVVDIFHPALLKGSFLASFQNDLQPL